MDEYGKPTGTITNVRRSGGLGMLADALRGLDDVAQRNVVSGFISDLLGVPSIATTADRASYGEPLTKGAGWTTQMLPETADTALAVGPTAIGVVRRGARGAKRALREPEPARAFADGGSVFALGSMFDEDEPVQMSKGGAVAKAINHLFGKQSKDVVEQVADEVVARDAAVGKEWRREPQKKKNPTSVNEAKISKAEWERQQSLKHKFKDVPSYPEPPVIGIEDLARKYGSITLLPGDTSVTGGRLMQAGDTKIRGGAHIYGGPRWADESAALGRDGAWMSRYGAAAPFQNKVVRAAEETGDPRVAGLYATMGNDAHGFALHTTDAILKALRAAESSPSARAAFDARMRSLADPKGNVLFPDFPGLDSVLLRRTLEANSDMRKAFVSTMSTPKYSAGLGVDGQAIRHAITEPELRDAGVGQMGFRAVSLDPAVRTLTPLTSQIHTTYDTVIPGSVAGRMRVQLPWEFYQPDVARQIYGNPKQAKHAWGTAKMGDFHQPITSEVVDSIGAIEEAVKARRGFAGGGIVRGALSRLAGRGERVAAHVDPKGTTIDDWAWRSLPEVDEKLGLNEIPDYIQKGYGQFMAQQAGRAASGSLGPRDLLKAYGITRSSVNRGGLSYDTATKTGMALPRTSDPVRPEGAFSEWLLSPAGQRYLNAAERGSIDERAIADMEDRFSPFGMSSVLGDDLRYAVTDLVPRAPELSSRVSGPLADWREYAQSLRGIGPAKSGFIASLVGRGDIPTFDARQIKLHTGAGGKDASKYTRRSNELGRGGDDAVDRLASRQSALGLDIDPALAPHYQHLAHHAVWDRVAREKTTHDDLVRAMRAAGVGGGAIGVGAMLDEESMQ